MEEAERQVCIMQEELARVQQGLQDRDAEILDRIQVGGAMHGCSGLVRLGSCIGTSLPSQTRLRQLFQLSVENLPSSLWAKVGAHPCSCEQREVS